MSLVLTMETLESQSRELTFLHRPLGLIFGQSEALVVKNVAPGSLAERFGVQPGWRMRAVHGVEVSRFSTRSIGRMMRECLDELPDIMLPQVDTLSDVETTTSHDEFAGVTDALDSSRDTLVSESVSSMDIRSESSDHDDCEDHDEILVEPALLEITFTLPNGDRLQRRFSQRPLGLVCKRRSTGLVVSRTKPGSEAEALRIRPGWRVSEILKSNMEQLPGRAVDKMLREFAQELDECCLPPLDETEGVNFVC